MKSTLGFWLANSYQSCVDD